MTELLVVVSGYASIDTTLVADRLAPPGETAILDGEVAPAPRRGGCAPNVALRLRRLDVPAALIAWLGDDEEGLAYRSLLEEAGVDLRGVPHAHGPSPRSVLVYGSAGDSVCYFHPSGADAQELPEAVDDLLADAGWLAVTVGPSTLTAALLERAEPLVRGDKLQLAWNVKADPRAFTTDLVARLAPAALVALNEDEAGFVGAALGLRRPAEPEDLLERGASVVALTRGRRGALVVWDGGREELQPETLAARGTTGAGDAFFAGMLAGLRAGLAPPEAAARGLASAADHLESAGAR
jgi:ribokinase